MSENKQPPPVKRNKKGIVQSEAEARSARKATSKKPPEKVLPPRQIEEASKSVELAAGERPFTSPMEKAAIDPKMMMEVPDAVRDLATKTIGQAEMEVTAIDPKMTMQVPDAVRDLATKTIDQAEMAIGMFFDAAKKSMASIRNPGTEISKQALSFTEQNVKASFDHARKLVQATDFRQAMQIQSEFLKSQFTNAGQHVQQVTSEIMSSAKHMSKGKP